MTDTEIRRLEFDLQDPHVLRLFAKTLAETEDPAVAFARLQTAALLAASLAGISADDMNRAMHEMRPVADGFLKTLPDLADDLRADAAEAAGREGS